MLKGKKILIGLTGSIAAYKVPMLVRLLKKEGAEVKVTLTPAAKDFVTPLTLSTLTENPVLSEFFTKEDGSWNSHIELGSWGDVFLIAPVSATTLGKMANGIADNLLTATYLAARTQVFFAPAMDVDMFEHPATTKNIEIIKSHGARLIAPKSGELASGLCGAGRMEEPELIVSILKEYFRSKQDFAGKKILVTAGPTHEAIDPVRYLGNHSSGKMGFAIAEEFADRGGEVNLISGPVDLNLHNNTINRIDVVTAGDMLKECLKYSSQADIIIMAAAVADYTPEKSEPEKIKKAPEKLQIKLKPTRDILQELGKRKSNQVVVGFALETSDEVDNAMKKLNNKNLDLIVLNSLRDKGAGFKHNTNKVTLIDRAGNINQTGLKSKTEIAKKIADAVKSLK